MIGFSVLWVTVEFIITVTKRNRRGNAVLISDQCRPMQVQHNPNIQLTISKCIQKIIHKNSSHVTSSFTVRVVILINFSGHCGTGPLPSTYSKTVHSYPLIYFQNYICCMGDAVGSITNFEITFLLIVMFLNK